MWKCGDDTSFVNNKRSSRRGDFRRAVRRLIIRETNTPDAPVGECHDQAIRNQEFTLKNKVTRLRVVFHIWHDGVGFSTTAKNSDKTISIRKQAGKWELNNTSSRGFFALRTAIIKLYELWNQILRELPISFFFHIYSLHIHIYIGIYEYLLLIIKSFTRQQWINNWFILRLFILRSIYVFEI